jgi:hypothetical protein
MESNMKKLFAAAAIAAFAVTPALAQQGPWNAWRAPTVSPLGYAPEPYANQRMAQYTVSPYAAIEANTVVGYDPDANVRLMLKRDALLNEGVGPSIP